MAEQKESSVLFSLKELMSLEEDRIRQEEDEKRRKAEAELSAKAAEASVSPMQTSPMRNENNLMELAILVMNDVLSSPPVSAGNIHYSQWRMPLINECEAVTPAMSG